MVMLVLRPFLFIIACALLVVGQLNLGILSRLGLSGAHALLILLLVYIGLMAWEIAEGIRYERDESKVWKGGFVLSFLAGGTFGMIGAFTGNAGDVNLGVITMNYVVAGLLFGTIGALLSKAIYRVVR